MQKRVIFDENRFLKAKIEGAKTLLKAYFKESLVYEYYPSEEMEFKVFIKWGDLQLPIKPDQKVGDMQLISKDGTILSSSSLYAKEKVKRTFNMFINDCLKKIF